MASRLWLKAASEPKNGGTVGSLAPGLSRSRPANHCLDGRDFPVNPFFRQYQCQRTVAAGKMKQRRISPAGRVLRALRFGSARRHKGK